MLAMTTTLAAGLALLPCAAAPREPVRLIFDTDMGNDIDDALALALIHALQSRGECRLLAVTLTKDNRYAAPFVSLVNAFYGRGEIPIGVARSGITPEDGSYTKAVVEAKEGNQPRYPTPLADWTQAPAAVPLLRRVLAAQPDGSVAIVQVGFSTNLAGLLQSEPDEHSPLNGRELVRRKVRLLSPMAGAFSEALLAEGFKEYNIVNDLPAARHLFAEWPTPLVASGFEVGNALLYPARSIEQEFRYVAHHPVAEAYCAYAPMPYDRPTWDLTSVLYAVRPEHGYFTLSPAGRITVSAEGVTRHTADAAGQHHYLQVPEGGAPRILEALQLLCSQPPDRR